MRPFVPQGNWRLKLKEDALSVNMPNPVKVNGTDLQQTNKLTTYLGSIIKPECGTKEDIYSRLSKARTAFREMNNI